MNRTQPLVLGIESSCDETGVGIVRGTTLLTNTVSSSMDEHVRFGGVIPEIASRAHLDAFVPTLEEALATALRTPRVRVTVAGRTDAGVHARGQVEHLDVAPDLVVAAAARARPSVSSRDSRHHSACASASRLSPSPAGVDRYRSTPAQ